MRRRSAGARTGNARQHAYSSRAALGQRWAAIWICGGHAIAQFERGKTGFAGSGSLLQRGARIHRASSSTHYVADRLVVAAAPRFMGFGQWPVLPLARRSRRASTRQRIGRTHS